MRSFGFTLLLGLIAALLCGFAGWHGLQGNFDSLWGAPPTPVGQRIYADFRPEDVKHLRITSNGKSVAFSLTDNGWQATRPWTDRMDPRAAVAIIHFTLGLRVEDFAAAEHLDPARTGLNERAVQIRLENGRHAPLAKYKLGRATPWKAELEEIENPVPTVYVHPRDLNHRRFIYACTGDIGGLFKDDLRYLRDHHPFYFNPLTLREIRIRSQQGELTLGRSSLQSAWRIVKPLELPTDPAAIKNLLEGLYELRAVQVMDRAAVTLPPADPAVKANQIVLANFDGPGETTLDLLPPESPDAQRVKAVVSDRPQTVFELPWRPEPGMVSLANLPISVNDLRDPALTHLNERSLRRIAIEPATGTAVVLTRDDQRPWMTTIEGVTRPVNEDNLRLWLSTLNHARATEFVSDAATDFTPWGLHRPFLVLRFTGADQQAIELRFGMDAKGGTFVNRAGSATVMRVPAAMITTLPVNPYQWRDARLWSIDRVNLVAIQRQESNKAPVILKYQFIDESWQAESDNQDLTPSLEPSRANYLLSSLESLKVARWLDVADPAAQSALAKPSLLLTVLEKRVDAQGEFAGITQRSLTLAPAEQGNSGIYYGRLSNERHPFTIPAATYQKIAVDLLER